MAIEPPQLYEYAEWIQVPEDDLDPRSQEFLELAAGLMQIATGLSEYPEGPCANLMSKGIMDMALRLQIGAENRAEEFTPFSGERIGSYSYSKASQVMSVARSGEPTGVELFDAAVMCAGGGPAGFVDSSSEHVMDPAGLTAQELHMLDLYRQPWSPRYADEDWEPH